MGSNVMMNPYQKPNPPMINAGKPPGPTIFDQNPGGVPMPNMTNVHMPSSYLPPGIGYPPFPPSGPSVSPVMPGIGVGMPPVNVTPSMPNPNMPNIGGMMPPGPMNPIPFSPPPMYNPFNKPTSYGGDMRPMPINPNIINTNMPKKTRPPNTNKRMPGVYDNAGGTAGPIPGQSPGYNPMESYLPLLRQMFFNKMGGIY